MTSPTSSSPPGSPTPSTPDPRILTDRILWFALLMSHGFYAVMLQVLPLQSARPAPALSGLLPLVALALMLAIAALSIDAIALGEAQIDGWIRAAQAAGKRDAKLRDAVVARVFPMSIIRWALADGVSIFGLIAAMIGSAGKSQALLFIAVGVAAHLYCRPKMARVLEQLAERSLS